jgi:UDP-N-acetylglucosamine 2-epimerase (hydrolysing)
LNKIKKIVFLTGTRADFGKLKTLINIIESSKLFECYIFVTGMHTLSKYGSTFQEIRKYKYKNIFVFMNQTNSTDLDIILSNTITGFSNFIKEINPDMIVIHGDRVESLTGAIVGSFNGILVAHIEGGELSGNIDESIRHSISKLSNIHFVSNLEAKNRLIQMGEKQNSIFEIGSPDIDVMLSKNLPSLTKVKKYYNIPFKNFGVVIYHPETDKLTIIKKQIKELILALEKSGNNFVIIYPNNDNGSNLIIEEYDKIKENKQFRIFPSIRFEYFLQLLKESNFIIGNSSSGIREAEIYGTPSINVGLRQINRTKNSDIINVNSNKNDILKALKEVKNKKVKKNFTFGNGNSSQQFYKILKNKEIWKISLQKKFIDL